MNKMRRSYSAQDTILYKPRVLYTLPRPSGDKHHEGISKPEDAGRDAEGREVTSVQGREEIRESAIQTCRGTARAKPAGDGRPGKLTALNVRGGENAVAARWPGPDTAGLY